MCNFLSALVFKSGDIYAAPEYTDSHSDLIAARGLVDTTDLAQRLWCRVEFSPPGREYDQPEKYTLRVDEKFEPTWFAEHRDSVEKRLRTMIEKMIVRDKREIILGGCVILADGAKVGKAVAARCAALHGGTLSEMRGGTLSEMRGGTLSGMYGGTLSEMRGGTLSEMRGAAKIANDYRTPAVKS